MSQVRIKVAPSRTGPTFEPWTSMPLSSMMMAFEGGTVKKGQKISVGQKNFFFEFANICEYACYYKN